MKVQQEYSGRERKAAFLFIEGGDIFCATIRLNFQIQTLEAVLKKVDLHFRLTLCQLSNLVCFNYIGRWGGRKAGDGGS